MEGQEAGSGAAGQAHPSDERTLAPRSQRPPGADTTPGPTLGLPARTRSPGGRPIQGRSTGPGAGSPGLPGWSFPQGPHPGPECHQELRARRDECPLPGCPRSAPFIQRRPPRQRQVPRPRSGTTQPRRVILQTAFPDASPQTQHSEGRGHLHKHTCTAHAGQPPLPSPRSHLLLGNTFPRRIYSVSGCVSGFQRRLHSEKEFCS